MRFAGIAALFMVALMPGLPAQENSEEPPGEIRTEPRIKQRRKIVLKSAPEKQITGRQTLTQEQIKNAPATFGDALNALTTLPGIMRTDVLFGTLIVRGAGNAANRYFVDGIPIPRPQHFGGLHSVLNNDIIKEANIYASAFPVTFGNATGAILDFSTIDDVDKVGGVVEANLLSANFLLKTPWSGSAGAPEGYWIASGRVGYLPLVVPTVYQWISGDSLFALPQYYDYQVKGKIVLDDQQEHSLTLLAIGSYDTVKVLRSPNQNERTSIPEISFLAAGTARDISAHSVGIYYDYEPSRRLKNHLLLYDTFVRDAGSYNAIYSRTPENNTSYPNLAGVKNTLSLAWLGDAAKLNFGTEYALYYFAAAGNFTRYSSLSPNGKFIQFNDYTLHHVPSAYLENKFHFGPLRFSPGVRADYLPLTRNLAVGPRGAVSWEFPGETVVEAAGGVYQSFPQVNMALINENSYYTRQLTNDAGLPAEEAIHRSLSVSQKYRLWNFKIEGYLNNFYRQVYTYNNSATSGYAGDASTMRNAGAEFSVRKAPHGEGGHDYYGWASYTLSRNNEGSYLSRYDQTHVLKLVAGYLYGLHNVAVRFDLYSGFAYTPIVGSEADPDYPNFSRQAYFPTYGSTQSARFPMVHRISVRYSQERKYEWGSWKWYVEVVNATNYAPVALQAFDYNQPYQPGVNPVLTHYEPKIPILPSIGVEIRF